MWRGGCGRLLQAEDEAHLLPLTSSPAPYKPGPHTTTLPDSSIVFGSALQFLLPRVLVNVLFFFAVDLQFSVRYPLGFWFAQLHTCSSLLL